MRRPATRSNSVRSCTDSAAVGACIGWWSARHFRDLVGRPFDRRIGRVDHQRLARRQGRAFFGDLLEARREMRWIVLAGVDLARDLGIADRRRRHVGFLVERLRLAAPQADPRPHQPHATQEGRAQDAEDQRQVGAVHAERRRHGDEGEGSAGRLDQGEAAAARMGQHQLAEAADQGQADQPARSGVGGGGADIAQPDAGHAHHQQRQQQQRQAQAEEAEMMGAHHAHAPGDQRHRHQDDGEPEGLQQQVGDVGAGHAHRVVRRAAGRMVERGIARAVGEQRQQHHHAQARDGGADQLHHAPPQEVAPAFRQDRGLAGSDGGGADDGHGRPRAPKRGGSSPRALSARHAPGRRGCSVRRC